VQRSEHGIDLTLRSARGAHLQAKLPRPRDGGRSCAKIPRRMPASVYRKITSRRLYRPSAGTPASWVRACCAVPRSR